MESLRSVDAAFPASLLGASSSTNGTALKKTHAAAHGKIERQRDGNSARFVAPLRSADGLSYCTVAPQKRKTVVGIHALNFSLELRLLILMVFTDANFTGSDIYKDALRVKSFAVSDNFILAFWHSATKSCIIHLCSRWNHSLTRRGFRSHEPRRSELFPGSAARD